MAIEKIGDGLKKVLLVGIGAAATTVEKSQQIIEELVKKGEITVEQGKELNKELQHNVKKTFEARKAEAESFEEKIAKMGADELNLLKEKIKEAEEAASKKLADAAHAKEEALKEEADNAAVDEIYKKEGVPFQPINLAEAEEEKPEEEKPGE